MFLVCLNVGIKASTKWARAEHERARLYYNKYFLIILYYIAEHARARLRLAWCSLWFYPILSSFRLILNSWNKSQLILTQLMTYPWPYPWLYQPRPYPRLYVALGKIHSFVCLYVCLLSQMFSPPEILKVSLNFKHFCIQRVQMTKQLCINMQGWQIGASNRNSTREYSSFLSVCLSVCLLSQILFPPKIMKVFMKLKYFVLFNRVLDYGAMQNCARLPNWYSEWE